MCMCVYIYVGTYIYYMCVILCACVRVCTGSFCQLVTHPPQVSRTLYHSLQTQVSSLALAPAVSVSMCVCLCVCVCMCVCVRACRREACADSGAAWDEGRHQKGTSTKV